MKNIIIKLLDFADEVEAGNLPDLDELSFVLRYGADELATKNKRLESLESSHGKLLKQSKEALAFLANTIGVFDKLTVSLKIAITEAEKL